MTRSHDEPVTKALRILHVDSERTWRGGERQVLELMRRQRRAGDDPHLAAPRDGVLFERARSEGFSVHPVPMRGTWDVASAFAIAGLHRRLRPHLVHWHAARAHALGAVAALLAPGPARVLSRRVDFPVRRSLGSRLLWALPLEAVAAISEGVREALARSGVDPSRVRVVPSGIDLSPYETSPTEEERGALRATLGIAPGETIALQAAALAPHKSQTDLLKAASIARERAPRLRVWIAGEGPLRAALEAEHAALGLGTTVRLLGFREDVGKLLAAADFFVVSSYLEGMGTATLDAMAAGLPVVATRTGGIPEIVADGETGILVPARDPKALADAMVRVTGDPALRGRLGAAGRERARLFSADRTAEGTRRVYEEALAARGHARPRRERVAGSP
ncbi:MAG TPA: glycosyltransferase family 4 protein [Candidatus Eisenbacteria bacterium]|nr:glycosyltransferase family 4 protein [Candidatus Eisenbacteria bacterium]